MAKESKPRMHACPAGYYLDFGGAAEGDDMVKYLSDSDLPPDDPLKKWITLEEKLPWEMITEDFNARDEIVKLLNDVFERTGLGWRQAAILSGSYYEIRPVINLELMSPADRKLLPPFTSAIKLFSLGKLSRVRRCARKECAKWFFAKLAYQRFHSDECRNTVRSADPGRKQRRAKYMREHRRTKKFLAQKKKKGGK